jgi:hypothetical protein
MSRATMSMLSLITATAAVMLTACAREPSRSAAMPPLPRTGGAPSPPASSDPFALALIVRPEACPLARLRGVRAEAADVPGGVAIVFDGPDRVVDLLRANVRAMASASSAQQDPFGVCRCAAGSAELSAAAAPGDEAKLGRTSMQPPSSRSIPPSAASVEETPSGGTLVLHAEGSPEVEVLRTAARLNVRAMEPCLAEEGP